MENRIINNFIMIIYYMYVCIYYTHNPNAVSKFLIHFKQLKSSALPSSLTAKKHLVSA